MGGKRNAQRNLILVPGTAQCINKTKTHIYEFRKASKGLKSDMLLGGLQRHHVEKGLCCGGQVGGVERSIPNS